MTYSFYMSPAVIIYETDEARKWKYLTSKCIHLKIISNFHFDYFLLKLMFSISTAIQGPVYRAVLA